MVLSFFRGPIPLSNLRTSALLTWLERHFCTNNLSLLPLTGDAGFRCYFRFYINEKSFIAVDAPVKLSNNQAFVDIQTILEASGVTVPNIIACDLEQGFLCLTDFGDTVLAQRLSANNMQHYYSKALDTLNKIAKSPMSSVQHLPVYDAKFIHTELNIFTQWLLNQHLNIHLSKAENEDLTRCFTLLTSAIIEQPQVFMHRDYHSRNIMLINDDQLGIIDFQDAVQGPITYDLVSLLRDCYVRWPSELIAPLIENYRLLALSQKQQANISQEKWQYWFDFTGLQRHIKASGIFARLYHRDNKPGYLADIPLTLSYIQDISAQYDQLSFLHQLVKNRVLPALNKLTPE